MSFIITNNKKISLRESFKILEVDEFSIHFDLNSNLILNHFENHILIYRGYFGVENLDENTPNCDLKLISLIEENIWPLPDKWAGSFNFVLFNKESKTFYLGNDSIGIYPCYYNLNETYFAISNSLGLISKGIESPQVDDIGVFQRMVYEYSNIGSRTIIKTVKSLLPGELIKFDCQNSLVNKKYDNSLFGEVLYNDLKDENINKVFEKISFEYEKASERFSRTHIALSGGMDSRLILGLVDPQKVGICLTYGANEFYETKIAKRLANAYRFKFQNYYQSSDLWPTIDELNKIQIETESLTISTWNTILKNIQSEKNCNILLGDMCESLPGRNIKSFSSRNSRVGRFVKSILLNKKIEFTLVQTDSFEKWAEKKLKNFSIMLKKTKVFSEAFKNNEEIINETVNDLKDILNLIKHHNIPYVELYDEIFEWYIHARLPMGKQVTIFDSHFDGQCPSMGLMALRTVSKIHPNLRVDYHFMDKIFKRIEVYKPIKNIPILQSPFLPFFFPNYLRLMVWGLRNKIDQFLIRRIVKNKNHKLRFRLLESINSASLYHELQSEEIVNQYFLKDNFNLGYLASKMYNGRKNLSEWPLSNNDIIAFASLNVDLNQIFKETIS
jgi:hypothetical protein